MKMDVEARVREGVKAVLEEVLQEEMTEHLEAGYRELTPTRRGERNGYYTRNLVTPAGKIERLTVPRDREGEFVTEVFERYKQVTGNVQEAILPSCNPNRCYVRPSTFPLTCTHQLHPCPKSRRVNSLANLPWGSCSSTS